jgi:acyl-CoA thioester hydrolase
MLKVVEQQTPPLDFETRVRVRYAETDQMGVVYHANYYVWMEIGRVEYVRSCGLEYKDLERDGLFLAVVETQCRYLSPARYDDEVAIRTRMTSATARTVEFAYDLRSGLTDRLLASGSTRHMWLNHDWRPTALPDLYRSALGITKRNVVATLAV